MKVKIEVELKPFTVPNFVLPVDRPNQQLDDQPQSSFPLSALDPLTLERLCDEFRDAVFRKAGKGRPPQQG